MRQRKIYMKNWLDYHKRIKVVDTDQWYLDLANEMLPLVAESRLCRDDEEEGWQEVALAVALYLEDCVADGGNWRQFIHWHHNSYGRYLPFYSLTDEYLPDEINREDIAFLLWTNSPTGNDVENPLGEDLQELAGVIYNLLDNVFEEAPISEHLATCWLIETELMEKKREPLPVALPGEKLPVNVGLFLEASNGEPLMFFDSYDKLKSFLVQALKWENKAESLLPDLYEFNNFVLYANPKGLLVGLNMASYIADKHNPLYNAEEAKEKAYELFCYKGSSPFDLLKYAMAYDLLPEAQFPFENGKRLLHENWDFVARWFLGNYYEGK